MRRLLTRTRLIVLSVGLVAGGAVVGLLVSAALSGDGGRPKATGALKDLPGQVRGSGEQDFSPDAARAADGKGTTFVATARGRSIRVYRHPHGGRALRSLQSRRAGAKRLALVFLVRERRPGWVRAYLPSRPNLSSGWLRARDVNVAANRYRLSVALHAHRLTAWRDGKAFLRARIGTGKALSPTPTGRYFVTDLLRPPDPRGFYGPYAFGLSAHSPVYTSFAGGDGQVGIHGTNQPDALGQDVSHGCIRVRNRVIARLAKLLPLGTPVDVSRT